MWYNKNMEINITKEEILDGLLWATRFLFTKNNIPSVTSVEITAEKEEILIKSANLDTITECKKRAEIKENGNIIVNGRALLEIIKLLPEGNISIKKEKNKIVIKTPKTTHNLPTVNTEINIIKDEDFLELFEIETNNLIDSLNQNSVAVAKNDATPILTAVNIKIEEKNIETITIDRHRVTNKKTPIKKINSYDKNISIKYKNFSTIINGLEKNTQTKFYFSEKNNKVDIRSKEKRAVTSIIAGEFPKTEDLFKGKYNKKIIINQKSFLDAINRTSVLIEDMTGIILKLKKNLIVLQNENVDAFSTEEIECEYNGEEFNVKFNAIYLKEGVSQITEEDIVLKIEEPQKPAEIVGYIKEKNIENDDFRYVVVPIRET
jgi:DNA polymerase-3 subunit beta